MPCLGLLLASPWLDLVGRLHPLVVHFPIALILAAGVAELWGLRRGEGGERAGWAAGAALFCLVLGALSATAAAGSGLVNAAVEPHGRSVAELIERHRWSGLTVAVLAWAAVAAALLRSRAAWLGVAYRLGLALACAAVVVTGHLGASLVWGEGYLVAPFEVHGGGGHEHGEHAPPVDVPSAGSGTEPTDSGGPADTADSASDEPGGRGTGGGDAAADRIDYGTVILPIFEEHCVRCHGPDRHKAGLRLDDPEELFVGGSEWWVVQPGSRAKSELYRRITLPADDEDRMPGEGDPLSPEDIERIGRWIDQGAETGAATGSGQ